MGAIVEAVVTASGAFTPGRPRSRAAADRGAAGTSRAASNEDAMIAVIGAGLIGLAIANELARRGAEVRVFETGEPGRAASWAGAGMLAPHTEASTSPAFDRFCAQSLDAYPAFVEDVRAVSGVDPHLRLDGILEAAFDRAAVARSQARVATLAARGVDAVWLDRAGALEREPALGGGVLGASLVRSEGRVDNRRLGRALRAACVARGVIVESARGPVALEADARRVRGIRTTSGFTAAASVVNAAGAWAGALEGVPERARVPVVPVKGQMLALAMPRALVRGVIWVPGAYLVPRDDGRLLVGATVEDAAFDVRVTARGMQLLLDAALGAMPALRDLAVAETWAGLRPGTPDGMPYLGMTSLEGYVVASGHYRNGILLAPATAQAVADVLEGSASRADIAPFSPSRATSALEFAR